MPTITKKPKHITQLLLLCGVIIPPTVAILVICVGLATPGYSHLSNTISKLGAIYSPHAEIMNSGLVVIGLFVNGFAYGFYRIINNYKLAKTIWILFAISGVGFSLTGVFQVTPFWTADDIIHNVFALIAYFSSLAAIAICAKTVFCVPEWNIYRQFSFVVVILGLSLVVLFNIQTLDSIEGLVQRVLLALPLLWVELVSLRSLQLLHSDGIV